MRYAAWMATRTTLALDEDVLAAARALADRERRSMGEIASELMRKGLAHQGPRLETRNGFPVLPKRGVVITPELINALRDDEE